MAYISEILTAAPESFKSPLQEKTYETLELLHIPFQRVETGEIVTMDDCIQVNEKLDMKMVKTLFLCNRQKTGFYLFVTRGDKAFKSRDFDKALDVARVSFAPVGLMEEMLGTKVGAATIFSALVDREYKVRVVIDEEVAREEWYGCSDGTTTGYMKVKTSLITHDLLNYARHIPAIIKI